MTLLCKIIAQGGKASAETFRQRASYDTLARAGLVQETGVVQSLVCGECDDAHDAEIVFEDGRYGYFCPEVGFVSVARDRLTCVKPDVKKLIELLADAFTCKRRKTTPIHGPTWRIGTVDTVAGDLVLYFHPQLQSSGDVHDCEAALRREVNSPYTLFLTAEGALEVHGAKTARLDEVVKLDTETGVLMTIADVRRIVDAPTENPAGRPNLFGDKLADIALSRTQNGQALTGLNKEARAVLDAFRTQFPNENPPSMPTVKRHLSKIRSGS